MTNLTQKGHQGSLNKKTACSGKQKQPAVSFFASSDQQKALGSKVQMAVAPTSWYYSEMRQFPPSSTIANSSAAQSRGFTFVSPSSTSHPHEATTPGLTLVGPQMFPPFALTRLCTLSASKENKFKELCNGAKKRL